MADYNFMLFLNSDAMDNIFKRLTGNDMLMFSLIFVISIGFYSFNIGFSDLWSDETYTKSMLNGTVSDFYDKIYKRFTPAIILHRIAIVHWFVWVINNILKDIFSCRSIGNSANRVFCRATRFLANEGRSVYV